MITPVTLRNALLLSLALPLSAFPGEKKTPAEPTPLSASVMIFNEWGLRDATRMVDLVAANGHRRVNFVITIHSQLDKNLGVLNYGLIRATEGWQFSPFDKPLLAQFRRQLSEAFARAARHDLQIAILPHVDAAGPQYGWRNEFDLDPLKPCGGYSYQRAMIDTVADALEESINETTRVEFALTGEMGRPVFAYPESYRKVMAELRQRRRLKHLKTGVSVNFNRVSGTDEPTPSRRAAVQKLIEESDFLGVSCYGAVSVPPKARDFTAMIDDFAAEMKGYGVIIPEGLDLHFSEVGLGGGGRSGKPEDIAGEPAEAAASAWAGTSDPEKTPWKTEKMREFRRDYYRALLEFLRTQPARWRVSAAFLWDSGSWCPYGFGNPAFADPEIIAMVRRHNAANGPRP